MARTDTLGHFLTDVADAIREKKGTSDTIQASEFDTEITNLPSGGDISNYININPSYGSSSSSNAWWANGFSNEGMENVEINIPSNGAGYMFYNCKWTYIPKLTTNGVSRNNITFAYTFNNCTNVTKIDLSHVIGSVASMQAAFASCTSLLSIDVRNLTLSTATRTTDMLKSVPTNCEIIVANQTEKDWFNTNFPTMTNVKTVEEYEAEQSE